jgi:hypothetical protein
MKNISKRCGKISCVNYYPKAVTGSCCRYFSDRTLCSVSMKQRRKNKNHSKRNADYNQRWS